MATRTRTTTTADLMFRAFADETRLRILHLLRDSEMCVGDLVEVLRVPQPTVSRHLAYLRRAGLVVAHQEGLWRFYRLASPRDDLHRRLVRCIASCFDEVTAIRRDTTRAAQLRARGGCCPRRAERGGD